MNESEKERKKKAKNNNKAKVIFQFFRLMALDGSLGAILKDIRKLSERV